MTTRTLHTVTLASYFEAVALVDLFAGNAWYFRQDGNRVVMDGAALEHLGDLDEDADGFYDGQCIWVDGLDYAVHAH